MWHEARKQEKKLRVLIVDYRRRAERRREFYEKFKADPTQFMQVHGRPTKIHIEPHITAAAENCMMPWQGNEENLIDRFDVRAHLDYIPEYKSGDQDKDMIREDEEDPALVNYERYRILIQNDLALISEDKFLHQIHIEEQFGTSSFAGLSIGGIPIHPGSKHMEGLTPKSKPPKAAIAYNYEDSTPTGSTLSAVLPKSAAATEVAAAAEEDSDEDLDFDLLVNVNDLTLAQTAELNNNGTKYGLGAGDFMRFLNADLEEKEQLRLAKIQEEEKQAMSGRKARRERRAYKDKIIMKKGYVSPPSYAARDSPTYDEYRRSSSDSKSRSNSPEKITFITSFGGNESDEEKKRAKAKSESEQASVFGPALPPRRQFFRLKRSKSRSRSPKRRRIGHGRTKSKSRSRSRSRNRDKGRRRRSKSSRSTSRTRDDRRRGVRRRSSTSSSRDRDKRRTGRRRSSTSSSRDRARRRGGRRRSSTPSSRDRERRRGGRRRSSTPSSRDRDRRRGGRRRSSTPSSKHSKSRSRSVSSSSSSSSVSRKRSKSIETSANSQLSTNGKCHDDQSSLVTSTTGAIPAIPAAINNKLPSPPIKRYYGRRKGNDDDDGSDKSRSSSPVSSDSDSRSKLEKKEDGSINRNDVYISGVSGVPKGKSSVSSSSKAYSSGGTSNTISATGSKMTPQERLKRRTQSALNRQLKADKEAEKSRVEKLVQERMEREESLRELTIKYRRREREKRHRNLQGHRSSSNSSGSSKSRSRSRSRSQSLSSRSPSPKANPCLEF